MRRPQRRTVGVAAAGAVVAATGAAVAVLSDQERVHRIERTFRIWRLTARRGGHWVAMKAKGRRVTEAERAALDEQFAIRTAQDVAEVLGGMKGAIMKAGQMLSFIADGLPQEAQEALATLQADVPPMAPTLAEGVVQQELGADVGRLFLEWDPVPVAAASIGQVHRAVLPDGRIVAVKVQYPGVDKAIKSDLDNAEMLYGLFASFALKNLDVKGLVDELRARMADELDYRLEARFQSEFAERFDGHPFVRVPKVVPERSSQRVLTSEWVDGLRFDDFVAAADDDTKQRAAEVVFRFAQGSIFCQGVFNGDPHPGNYRFHPDGTVTFLDFGLTKRWEPGEWEALTPVLDALLAHDAPGTRDAMVAAGFLPGGERLDPELVFSYVSGPWEPFLTDQFTYTKGWVSEALQKVIDLQGTYGEVIKALNMPTSYVILDRVVWGVSAILGRLGASGNWRALLAEYREDAPPSTELGRAEAEWRARSQPVLP